MKPKTVRRARDVHSTPAPEGRNDTTNIGLLADSIILTLEGEMRVCDVTTGTRVITRDSGVARVTATHRHQAVTRAVHIKAGTLGDTRPDRDVTLPADQPVFVRDWRAQALFGKRQTMVAAHQLIDGEFITHQDVMRLDLCEIEFEVPHIIYVDGLEVAGHIATNTSVKAA